MTRQGGTSGGGALSGRREQAQAAEVTEDVKAEEEPAEQRSQAEQGERKGKEREQEQERRKERQREGEGEKEGRRRMPVRQYLDTTVVPILREGLRKLVKNRPEDPIGFLIEYLQEHRTSQSPGSQQ